MTSPRIQIGFFVTLTLLMFGLTLWLFLPFLGPIVLATVLAIVFYPVHTRIASSLKSWPSVAAGISTLLILCIILAPLSFFGWLVVDESIDVYQTMVSEEGGETVLRTVVTSTEQVIEGIIPFESFSFNDYVRTEDAREYVLTLLSWVQKNIGPLFSRVVDYSLGIFVLIIALFALLRDGRAFLIRVTEVSPLHDEFDYKIIERVHIAVNSVVRGEVVIALLQGIATGIGFWLFSIPHPAIWGLVAAIAAFIPTVGTTVVFIPAIIYVLYTGGWVPAVGVFTWGAMIVGLLDNVLRPVLIDRGMNIHPFLILVSVLGGLHVFGPIGFVVGPVILGLFFALLDIYPLLFKRLTR